MFNDLTDAPGHPALHHDPLVGYPENQSLVPHLHRSGFRGLIYPSVQALARSGNCVICFEPHAIQKVRPCASWNLVWDGTQHYAINAVGHAGFPPSTSVSRKTCTQLKQVALGRCATPDRPLW